jgi:hypothetical protein
MRSWLGDEACTSGANVGMTGRWGSNPNLCRVAPGDGPRRIDHVRSLYFPPRMSVWGSAVRNSRYSIPTPSHRLRCSRAVISSRLDSQSTGARAPDPSLAGPRAHRSRGAGRQLALSHVRRAPDVARSSAPHGCVAVRFRHAVPERSLPRAGRELRSLPGTATLLHSAAEVGSCAPRDGRRASGRTLPALASLASRVMRATRWTSTTHRYAVRPSIRASASPS